MGSACTCCYEASRLSENQVKLTYHQNRYRKLEEIETYALDLLHETSTWTTQIAEPTFTVKTRENSRYTDEVPILYLNLVVPKKIPPEMIDRLMSDPEERAKWDGNNIMQFEILDTDDLENVAICYILNRFPWPMQNREFIELRQCKKLKGEIRHIFFSLKDDLDELEIPEQEKPVTRGEVHLGFRQFIEQENSTQIIMMSQTNSHLGIKNPAMMVAKAMKLWVKLFQNALMNCPIEEPTNM